MATGSKRAEFTMRLTIAAVVALAVFCLLALRFWYLQGVRGEYFRDLSNNNRIRKIRTAAPRGKIFDRNGALLVGNRPAFQIGLMLEDAPRLQESIEAVAKLVGEDEALLRQRLEQQRRGTRPFEPKIILRDVSRDLLARIKAQRYRLPGVIVGVVPVRTFPEKSLASAVLGYAREITGEQLKRFRAQAYFPGDVVGQNGLERHWEQVLRGQGGYKVVEVDAMGTRRGVRGRIDFVPGSEVHLTLDLNLQRTAEEALGEHRGAVVALDPRNGDVLAMASRPGIDLNMFSGVIRAPEWHKLITDKQKPLTNRAISATYPPGSTFKLITALAALAEGKAVPNTSFHCPGYYSFAGRRYRCHKRSGHGTVNLQQAVERSCNAYFFQLGQMLGIDLITKYARAFGVGQKTRIALPGEATGVLPSRSWKVRVHGERWYPGDTLPVSIGQGYLTMTPLQLANAISALVNGGVLYVPRVVQRVVDPREGEETVFEPVIRGQLQASEKHFEAVKKYAASVVQGERGTGKRARVPGVNIGGKTGTAQVASLGRGGSNQMLKDHAWFVGFAPVEAPQIVVSVLVENAGHGGVAAAPVAQAVLEQYFVQTGQIPPTLTEEPASDLEQEAPIHD